MCVTPRPAELARSPPYAGVTLAADGGRTWRLGTRVRLESALDLSRWRLLLEASVPIPVRAGHDARPARHRPPGTPLYPGRDSELYDLEADPGKFEDLWDEPAAAIKSELLLRSFDASMRAAADVARSASARCSAVSRTPCLPRATRFGNMRLHRTDHARVSARFDAAGAANRAFETLRATLRTARQQGQLDPDAPDACAKIVHPLPVRRVLP